MTDKPRYDKPGNVSRYVVRHPLPGQPKRWSVIDAATSRNVLTTTDYEAARSRAVEMNEAWFAEPDQRDWNPGHAEGAW
jgi:hypothetical protein